MLADIGGKVVANSNVTATAKVQKGIIQKCLSGERDAKIDNWQPRYMSFPMTAYTKRGGIDEVDGYNSVKKHYAA